MLRPASTLVRNIAVAGVLLVPAVALAADDAHGAHEVVGAIPSIRQGLATGITAIVVFIVVAVVLGAKVWPTISGALDERAEKIRSEIEAAEMAQKQAKAALEQYERNLADARAEAQQMITDAVAQQQALAAENKARAEQEINQMRDRARRDIDAAKRAAVEEIYSVAINQATSMASKILRREVTAADQQRLMEESLAELQTMGRN
jgi:F-type H+-transporting ATPase subunit b